ncbi:MAG: hypothetical protein ACTHMG_16310 [Sphingomonas sp.]
MRFRGTGASLAMTVGALMLIGGCGRSQPVTNTMIANVATPATPQIAAPDAAIPNEAAAQHAPADPAAAGPLTFQLSAEQQMRRDLLDMSSYTADVRRYEAEDHAKGLPFDQKASFAALDRTGDGKLSPAEWATYAVRLYNGGQAEAATPAQLGRAADAFFHFDLNGDSYLEPDELDLAQAVMVG